MLVAWDPALTAGGVGECGGWMEPTPRDTPWAGRGCSVLTASCQHTCPTCGHLRDQQTQTPRVYPATKGLSLPMPPPPVGYSCSGIMAKHQGSGLRDREGPSPGGAVSSWLCFIE